MDQISFSSSTNSIKSSNINSNNCIDVLSEDLTNYNQHLKNINVSKNAGISPLDLTVDMIRLTMTKCQNKDTQKWSFFTDFSNLQKYQKSTFNPKNYKGITNLKSEDTEVYIQPKETKLVKFDIYSGNNKVNNYSNVVITIANSKIAEAKRVNNGVNIVGKSVGSTTLTIKVHSKKLVYNVIVSDVNDKLAFLDIQTYDDSIGDSIVIHSTNTKGNPIFAMIDTGKARVISYEKVIGYLKANNIKQLEWLLITHFHGDHYGGLNQLINSGVTIKKIYTKQYHALDSTVESSKYKTVSEFRSNRMKDWNDMIKIITNKKIPIAYVNANKNNSTQLGNYHFTFMNVEEAFDGYGDVCAKFKNCNENTNSVIAVVKNNGRYYYLNGDIDSFSSSFSKSDDEKLKKAYNNRTVDKWVSKAMKNFNIKNFDLMKASHHGVLYNNIKKAYTVGKPTYAVVTCHKEFLRDRLSVLESRIKSGNSNAKVYYTGNGIVTVNQDKKGNITVLQGRDEHNEYK
ncbi:hypothetical protein BCR36DRAFT_579970 [Piromyces finnis]|uniref:Metallo-beta-lactamase domain-containing protein n=1 Tax=Piromyces finnis TaxID=1754191 RepID=A0A1Y1VJX7_9FUNG|nr:hypothetical protein BCR36DRAFT_579970 [Piromyces finnis]|eukprot:ORX58355.1 hypothetical protein BCR36DRAFT_579970 [Piromyces finnis]